MISNKYRDYVTIKNGPDTGLFNFNYYFSTIVLVLYYT